MKKLIALVIVATSILLVGCSKTPADNSTKSGESINENQESFKGTIKDILEKENNQICEFSFEDDITKESGTMYISEGRIKSSAKVLLKKENTNMDVYTVTDKEYTYTRNNTNTQGAKFKNVQEGSENNYKQDPLDEKPLNFTCKKGDIKESEFKIPENISFMDISEFLMKK